MTDAEIICEWMEPKPSGPLFHVVDGWTVRNAFSPAHWWVWFTPRNPRSGDTRDISGESYWRERPLTLDALHEVEERLTDYQWREYGGLMLGYSEETVICDRPHVEQKRLLHATAEQKIKALAAVLRLRAGIRTPVEGEKP